MSWYQRSLYLPGHPFLVVLAHPAVEKTQRICLGYRQISRLQKPFAQCSRRIRKRRSISFHMKKHSGKTIVDIGNAVGVSHSTVSRALRNDPRISPETTRKVIQAAYALGYVQNARPGQPVIGLFLPVKQLQQL